MFYVVLRMSDFFKKYHSLLMKKMICSNSYI